MKWSCMNSGEREGCVDCMVGRCFATRGALYSVKRLKENVLNNWSATCNEERSLKERVG